MTESSPKWLRLLPMILAGMLLTEATVAGMALIRLRHDCAQSADAITNLRSDMGVTRRRLQETGAQMAYALRPDVLRDQVAGRLAPARPDQIWWINIQNTRRPDALPLPSLLPQVASLEPAATTNRPQ